ncbi:hypothetical protein MTR67_022626 [Solanum verrucosum]|uniref:Uncharacterized protein n=1 Tax=Solanum verrucosum TaxID=315347 RepID=A0AAF0TQX9_SOLVR|nr:hypothetical protein MTR67_022626 [Solanum verrucosum]
MLCIKWIELHGDRAGYDDPAMVSDIGSIEGRSYLFIGHQLCNDNPFMSYGVFADLRSKELGQGEPIAPNLRAMFGLRVAIITILTNKGGSGKTLAIGCANKWLMLENSAFYVARRLVMNHVGIEAVACDFNGNRALSSLDTEGCCEERMLRLGSLPKITSTNKRRYPNKEPNNRIGGCLLEGSSYSGITFQEIISGSFPMYNDNPWFSWYLYYSDRLS